MNNEYDCTVTELYSKVYFSEQNCLVIDINDKEENLIGYNILVTNKNKEFFDIIKLFVSNFILNESKDVEEAIEAIKEVTEDEHGE